MTTHKDTAGIIKRLEAASGPSNELNALILKEIAPEFADTTVENGWLVGGNHAVPTLAAPFTSSIDSALSLVPEGLSATIVRYADGRGKAVLWRNGEVSAHFDSSSDNAGCPASPAIALCIAALRARSSMAERK